MDNKTVYVIDYCRLQSKSKHHHRAMTFWHSWRSSLLYQWKIEPKEKKTNQKFQCQFQTYLFRSVSLIVRRQVPISEMSCYTQTIFIDVQIFLIHSITHSLLSIAFAFWSGLVSFHFISLHGSIKNKNRVFA